jgi:heme-degrading monooxygenase HmoA
MHQLAQLNIAAMRGPVDSPLMAEFVANLDRINALADASPGLIWRLQTEDGDATALRPLGEDVLVNLSVWRDLEALQAFVYQSGHAAIMRRRREWFDRMTQAHLVLWWIPAGHRPDVTEAAERLARLRAEGPTPRAFNFAQPFPPPG